MLKKIVEYNSYISQEIAVSFINALKTIKTTQAAIATITNAPDTLVPVAQEEQVGEQNKAEVADKEEANPIKQKGPEENGQEKTQ